MTEPAKCADDCDCTPKANGWYWATHRKYNWRAVVQVRQNGHKHTRVYVAWHSGSFGLEEFTEYSAAIVDPLKQEQPTNG